MVKKEEGGWPASLTRNLPLGPKSLARAAARIDPQQIGNSPAADSPGLLAEKRTLHARDEACEKPALGGPFE
ncbi:MAG: hypothetical protein AAF961_05615, partial [Planctomycetota bacterium]